MVRKDLYRHRFFILLMFFPLIIGGIIRLFHISFSQFSPRELSAGFFYMGLGMLPWLSFFWGVLLIQDEQWSLLLTLPHCKGRFYCIKMVTGMLILVLSFYTYLIALIFWAGESPEESYGVLILASAMYFLGTALGRITEKVIHAVALWGLFIILGGSLFIIPPWSIIRTNIFTLRPAFFPFTFTLILFGSFLWSIITLYLWDPLRKTKSLKRGIFSGGLLGLMGALFLGYTLQKDLSPSLDRVVDLHSIQPISKQVFLIQPSLKSTFPANLIHTEDIYYTWHMHKKHLRFYPEFPIRAYHLQKDRYLLWRQSFLEILNGEGKTLAVFPIKERHDQFSISRDHILLYKADALSSPRTALQWVSVKTLKSRFIPPCDLLPKNLKTLRYQLLHHEIHAFALDDNNTLTMYRWDEKEHKWLKIKDVFSFKEPKVFFLKAGHTIRFSEGSTLIPHPKTHRFSLFSSIRRVFDEGYTIRTKRPQGFTLTFYNFSGKKLWETSIPPHHIVLWATRDFYILQKWENDQASIILRMDAHTGKILESLPQTHPVNNYGFDNLNLELYFFQKSPPTLIVLDKASGTCRKMPIYPNQL